MDEYRKNLGKILKQQRVNSSLTLQKLKDLSGVSPSHIARIERGERFPSASILKKICKHLGFEEKELLVLAGYLSPEPSMMMGEREVHYGHKGLDPNVAKILSQESVEVQRSVVGILTILKNLSSCLSKD